MRLRRLDLLRYGHFTDRSFELPACDIDFHIVFGPNESGKSTALSAIEDLLFGVPIQSPYNFLHDYSSMRIGAVLENGDKSLEIVRRKGLKDTLLSPDGLPLPGSDAMLRQFLGGADRTFFERMFSFDHIRLETGGREILEAKDEIGQILFSAGSGITGLRVRLAELSNEADNLWAARKAQHRKYYQADDKLKEAEKELRQQTLTANKWQELKRTYATAEEAHADLEVEFEKISAERTRFGRIRRVYPYLRQKAELDERIVGLGVVVPLPKDARQVFEETERKESEVSTRLDTFSGQLSKAREELVALTYDEQLLLHADDIVHLHERRIEVRGEKADLPKRRAELESAEAELRDLAAELGWQEKEVGELMAQVPVRAKLGAVRSLLGQRGELALAVENRSLMLEEVEAEHAALQDRLDATEETTDVSRLVSVVKMVRARGDVSGRVRSADQHVKDAQEHVERLLSSLHPGVSSEKAAAEMQVPSRLGVQDHRDHVQDWERRTRETAQQITTVEQELERARNNFQDAERDKSAISLEGLQEARSERDVLWRLVKQEYIENVPISDDDAYRYADVLDDLAAAFEPAMQAADELADRRFDNAEAAGRLAEMSRNIGKQEDALAHLRTQREALTQEGELLDVLWQTLWDKSPFDPLGPDAMLEWLESRSELLAAIERRADATSLLEIQRKEEHESKEELLTELSTLGINRATLENDILPVTLEGADSVRRDYEQKADTKVQLAKSLQEAVTGIERRRRELTGAKQAWSQWKEEWSAALGELGLATGAHPDAVSTQIDVIDQMREKVRRINDLRHQRIDKINRDVEDFEAVVATIVSKLTGELAGIAADDAVLEIEKRLRKAEHIRDFQASKTKEIEKIENTMHALEEDRQKARDSVNHLKDAAGADTSDALRIAIQKSEDLRGLQGALDTTMQTLEQQGDGLTIADLEAESDAIDIDRIAAREEASTIALRTLRERLTTAAETRAQARDAFHAIGGDDAAARAEARRQEALAEIREVSERYVRVRTSAMLLQWAIDRYRREKQGPLLKRAAQLFATITGNSFKDLRVDYAENNQAHLTGLRPDGEFVRVAGMSSGTEDQLYIALRVAAIEDYLDRADVLPFVADDLFLNFDNDRAGAGFEVLGELSKKTQVLFFTHHLHLLDIARETLGGSITIVNLNENQVGTTL